MTDDHEPEIFTPGQTPSGGQRARPRTGTGQAARGPAANEETSPSHEAPDPDPDAGDERYDDYGPAEADASPVDAGSEGVANLGADLAAAMYAGDFHPVVLVGTAFSGKTSLLLSLFATVIEEPRLETGLSLCDPILGSSTLVARQLHEEARHTFQVKTQAFIEGEKIPKTNVALPFFIPVDFKPPLGPETRFAFLESNGEWYRPLREKGKLSEITNLYPALRTELERFISSYQGGISFLYLAPYTQQFVYSGVDFTKDESDELLNASLAIKGFIDSYNRIRANHRGADRHLMLVTKWDAQSVGATDRAEAIREDREIMNAFCRRHYSQAITVFQKLEADQRSLNAYSSGMITSDGLLKLRTDDEVRDVMVGYPTRLWTWLYRNARTALGDVPVSPFPKPPSLPAPLRYFRRLLDYMSGG